MCRSLWLSCKKTPPTRLLEAIKDANDGGSPMSSRIARQVITAFKEGKILRPLLRIMI